MKGTTIKGGAKLAVLVGGGVAVVCGVACVGMIAKLLTDRLRPPRPLLVNSDLKYEVILLDNEELNHNTRLLRFKFSGLMLASRVVLGLHTGRYIYVSAVINGRTVVRPYTPISSDQDIGFMEMVVKVYGPCEEFPDGGKMSQHLGRLRRGQTIQIRGPVGHIRYWGRGEIEYWHVMNPSPSSPSAFNSTLQMSMIAGGTGITPMLQIIRAVFDDPLDKTVIALIFANKTVEDIIMRNRLDQLQATRPDRFKVWYTVDKKPREGEWDYSEGYVTREMIEEHLYPPGPDNVVMMCGPPPMIQSLDYPLTQIGFSINRRHIF